MFPALIALTFKPARVKTEASFTAEDPWNQNRRTPFTVEAYLMMPKGSTPKANTKPFGASYYYGIRSEVDGVERMLPESLSYLWSRGRIPAEALPKLLKEMGPMLRKTDFRLQFLSKAYTIMQYVVIGLFALILLGSVAAALSEGEGLIEGAMGVAIIGVICCGALYLAFYRPRARRRRQMDWALAHQ